MDNYHTTWSYLSWRADWSRYTFSLVAMIWSNSWDHNDAPPLILTLSKAFIYCCFFIVLLRAGKEDAEVIKFYLHLRDLYFCFMKIVIVGYIYWWTIIAPSLASVFSISKFRKNMGRNVVVIIKMESHCL